MTRILHVVGHRILLHANNKDAQRTAHMPIWESVRPQLTKCKFHYPS